MSEKRFAAENLPPDYQLLADAMNLDNKNIPTYTLPELPFDKNTSPEEFDSDNGNSRIPQLQTYLHGRSQYGGTFVAGISGPGKTG